MNLLKIKLDYIFEMKVHRLSIWNHHEYANPMHDLNCRDGVVQFRGKVFIF
ncbi:hypothetical protein LguiB_010020 [Lonicera macranthoides]